MEEMQLTFHPFQHEHFAEYAAWFADPALDRYLGPLDEEWLDAVLHERDEEGATWAVFRAEELVAVVGTCFDQERPGHATITELAVKPTLQRCGIGTAALQYLLTLHRQHGIYAHSAFVAFDNLPARRCIERAGFCLHTDSADEYGYLALNRKDAKGAEAEPFLPQRRKGRRGRTFFTAKTQRAQRFCLSPSSRCPPVVGVGRSIAPSLYPVSTCFAWRCFAPTVSRLASPVSYLTSALCALRSNALML
jgi:GNAT superfamily N-acetyltransferase